MRRSRLSAMVPWFGALAVVAGLQIAGAGSAAAQGLSEMSCSELWYARNAIYAEAGYCFKTRRARAVFGRRCYPPYGELSRWQRRRVSQIQHWEDVKGCGGY